MRDIHPDLARTVEVVVHEDNLGGVGGPAGRNRCRHPVAVHAERRAAGAALGQRACSVCPGGAMVDRFPDVGLERGNALATREIAEVDGVGLIRRQAVVAAVGVRGGHRSPGLAPVGRGVGERPAARGCVIKLPDAVRDDRGFPAVRSDVRQAVAWGTGRQAAGLHPQGRRRHQAETETDTYEGQTAPEPESRIHRPTPIH